MLGLLSFVDPARRGTRRGPVAIAGFVLAVLAILWTPARAGETALSDPVPTIDAPRRVIVSLSEGDERRINAVFTNLVNIQKFYGAEKVRLRLVAYGPGLRALLKDSPVKARVESLLPLDVEFVACGATLETMHKTEADLLEGVETVPAGLPEIIERQLAGWIHVHP